MIEAALLQGFEQALGQARQLLDLGSHLVITMQNGRRLSVLELAEYAELLRTMRLQQEQMALCHRILAGGRINPDVPAHSARPTPQDDAD